MLKYRKTYSNKMSMKDIDSKRNLLSILLKCFISVFIVYLIFTPIFYIYNKLVGSVWIFIIASTIQFLTIIFVGIFFRRKNSSILINNNNQFMLFCFLSGLSIFLHCMEIPETLYLVLTSTLGIYDIFADNLFFIILIEQLFDNYLITSFLICSTIVFFKPFKKVKAQNH